MNDQTASAISSRISPGSFHRPELDLLRFAAFLLVFVHHGLALTRHFQGGSWNSEWFELFRNPTGYGLCLFFVLSSYLITEILIRERELTGTIHLWAFYIRRVLRIWPLYACFLPVCYLFGRYFADFFVKRTFVLQYILFAGNYAFYHRPTGNPMGPLWSISVEEQFYLCWPLVALRFGKKGLLVLSLFTATASVATSSWLTAHAAHPGFAIWTNSLTEFGCFAAGALLALALHNKIWHPSHVQRLGLSLFGAASWLISDGVFGFKRTEMSANRQQYPHVAGFQLIIAGCCLLFLALLSLPLGRWARPFIYLGRISYGLYVFHILAILAVDAVMVRIAARTSVNGNVLSLLTLLGAFMTLFLVAALSYECFERRFLRLKTRFAYIRT